MKNAKWLNVTEYLLLAGSGIGSVAAIASQQIAFTAAPLSFVLLLNLVNRRRLNQEVQNNANASLEQLDRRLSDHLKTLNQQVRTLPSFLDLANLRKTILRQNEAAITQLQQNLSQRIAPLEGYDLGKMQQALSDLRSRDRQLTDSIASVSSSLNRLATVNRVEEAEGAVASQFPERVAQLKLQIDQLQIKLNDLPKTPTPNLPRAIQDQINHLNRRFNSLPQPFDATSLKQDVDGLIKVVGDLVSRREMARLMAEVEKIRQQNQILEQAVTPMKSVNYILRKQVETLASWVSTSQSQIHDPLSSSLALLEEALENAKSRVVVVFPYPDRTLLDSALIAKFKALLDRGAALDVGWGHLDNQHSGNQHQTQQPRLIHASKSANPDFLQPILSQLAQLKRSYPRQFRFKVLGTEENFLVADRSWASLGIHSVAASAIPKVAVGLRTTNAEVIRGLLDRFDNPSLGIDDAVAYYNRAITRYQLGDNQGAIADYSEVLRIDPDHDIACNNRALIRYELGDKEGAITDLNRALLNNPHRGIAYCNRGVIRLELGDKVGAIADYTDAIQVDPDCTIAYLQRGLARLIDNQTAAIEDFSTLIGMDAQNAIAHFHRGVARTTLGDKTGAIRDFKEAAWLFSAQGNPEKSQRAIAAVHKLRQRLVTSTRASALNTH